MAGGRNGITSAPVMRLNAPKSRPITAPAPCCGPVRSAKSFSWTNMMPAFGDVPAKLKPPAANMRCVSGMPCMIRSACFTTSIV